MNINLGQSSIDLPLPAGWTFDLQPGKVVFLGTLPDKGSLRNRSIRIVFGHDGHQLQHACKVNIVQQRQRVTWDPVTRTYIQTGQWVKGGQGGKRLLGEVLWSLVHDGKGL